MEKMTKREFYTALINFANTGVFAYDADNSEVTVDADSIIAFAENEIALLDKKSVKAKERAAVKKAENDELTDFVKSLLTTDDFQTAEDIMAKIEPNEDITRAKVSYRLGALAKNGDAEKTEIALPATDGGKKRRIMAYKLIG